MEIRVLRYFLAVAREQSITAAAESLHVTQPTLSKQLMDLESELGKKLFIRGNRHITLTEDGIYLRKRAQEIIDLFDKTISEFNSPDEIISGDVYIGAGETQSMRLIAKIITKLQFIYPQLHFHLFSGNVDSVLERLDKGLLDFGLLIEPTDIKKFDCLPIPLNDKMGLLLRKDNPLAKLDYIKSDDLLNIPLIAPSRVFNYLNFATWLKKDFEKLNIVSYYNLIFNASLLVEEGTGSAICIDNLLNTTGNSSLCFKPFEPSINLHSTLVWKKYQVFSKGAQKFLDELQKEFSK